jgi:hypothetical protein
VYGTCGIAGGFCFTTTPGATGNAWVLVDQNGSLNNSDGGTGATMPMLASEANSRINNAHQLQLMAMSPSGSYTLGRSIDASATATSTSPTTGNDVWGCGSAPCTGTFVPLHGNAGLPNFTGTFDGGGNTISGLTISSSQRNVGLFGQIDSAGTVQNVGLVGGHHCRLARSRQLRRRCARGPEQRHDHEYLRDRFGDRRQQRRASSPAGSSEAIAVRSRNLRRAGHRQPDDTGGLVTLMAVRSRSSGRRGQRQRRQHRRGLGRVNVSTITDAYATGQVSLPSGALVGGLQ